VQPEITYAFELDSDTATFHKAHFPVNTTLTIRNIESFYNYRTLNNDFCLVSSILSNSDQCITLINPKDGAKSNIDYEVIHENAFEDIPVSLKNIHLKKHRINSAMCKIKIASMNPVSIQNNAVPAQNNTVPVQNNTTPIQNNADHELLNYFAFDPDLDTNQLNVSRVKPRYCKSLPGTIKKPACLNCNEPCSYSMENILHPTQSICQNDIIEELEIHSHPKSRKITTDGVVHQRLTHEAARELADHYIFAHNKKKPFFL
jgi:hypothetical protein